MKAQQKRMTHAPKSATEQADNLRALLDNELAPVEKVLRDFQAKAQTICTDAAYEIKVASDYWVADVKQGIDDSIAKLQSPNYTPDDFRAAVLDGEIEDVPLIGYEVPAKLKAIRNGHVLKSVAEKIEVTGQPVAARSETKKQNKKVRA